MYEDQGRPDYKRNDRLEDEGQWQRKEQKRHAKTWKQYEKWLKRQRKAEAKRWAEHLEYLAQQRS